MKKATVIVLSAVILLVGSIVSVPLVNNATAKNAEKQLTEIPLPENTEMLESLSCAKKLVGGGNGMQYFGAMLIKSEKTAEELTEYYNGKLSSVFVKEQKTQQIEFIEHETLTFETPVDSGCYIVYRFAEGIPLFSSLDIRGH